MIVSIIILLFFIVQSFLDQSNRFFFSKSGVRLVMLLVGFILLQILRIYCQLDFPDIPEYKKLFIDAKSFIDIIGGNVGFNYFISETTLEVESGYRVFMSLFKSFSQNYSLYLFLVSIIELTTFCFFCKKMKISVFCALPVYISLTYITFQIGMFRQALACCVFFLAILNLHRKWIYLGLITIGFFFHRSMAFCVLLIWADRFISPKYLTYAFIVSLAIYLLKIELINDLWGHFFLEDSNRVNFYLNVERENNYLGIGFWERVISFVVMTYCYNKLIMKQNRSEYVVYNLPDSTLSGPINNVSMKEASCKMNKKTLNNVSYNTMTVLYNLGVSVILLQIYFFSSPTITSRLRYYIVIFPMIFIVEYIRQNINNYKKRLFFMLPVYGYLLLYLYTQASYLMRD